MSIVATSASLQQTPVKSEPGAAPTRVVLEPDSDSVDTPVETDANSAPGFGSVLAKQLDKSSANDLPVYEPAKKIDEGTNADGTPFLATTASNDPRGGQPKVAASGFGVPVTDDVDAKRATPRGAAKDTSGPDVYGTADDPTRQQRIDAAGDDVAAQIALVSQWAVVAQPVAEPVTQPATQPVPPTGLPPGTRTIATSGGGDGHDIGGRFDTIPATPAKTEPATGAEDPSLVAEGGVGVPFATATATATAYRNTNTTNTNTNTTNIDADTTASPSGPGWVSTKDVTSNGAITVAAASKTRSDANVAVGPLSIADALLGRIDAAATPVANDAASLTNAVASQSASQPASQVAVQVSSAQASIAPATGTLHEPVGTAAWSHEVGHAALRLATSDLQSASLRLNPEHLGPLDVQVRIENGTAHLAFHAVNADTRQAIETSRTTLDQLFAQQGLKIGDVAVGDSSRRGFDADASQGSPAQRDGGRGSRWGGNDAPADSGTQTVVTTRVSRTLGLVDTFA